MDGWLLQGLAWIVAFLLFASVIWPVLSRYVRDRTLRRGRTPLGAPVYSWKDPFGRMHTSRTHPALMDGKGDGSFGGGDWGDCGDGGDGGD